MRPFLSLLLLPVVLVVVVRAADPEPEPDADDAKKLVGTWGVVKAVKDGTPAPAKETAGMTLEITRETITVSGGDMGKRQETAKYTLDRKAKPRAIDLKMPGEVVHGIYRFDKDGLTICFTKRGGARPKAFDEAGATVLVLKMQKAKK